MEQLGKWDVGDQVQVSLPYGPDGVTVLLAEILRFQVPGPQQLERTVKVKFDDPLVYGGLGVAWVNPKVLTRPGQSPAMPDRDEVQS
jgi:hypothetical protein